MSTQQDIYAAGSENRPPMLNKDNYVLWSSRLLRYAKSKPNGKLIYNSIMHGPYTDEELTKKEVKQMEADDQAIQTILMGLPEDIYAAVDSYETTQEIGQMQMVESNGKNQFRQYVGQNVRNQNGYNTVPNVGNQVVQNAVWNPGVQNVRNQNGLLVVPGIANPNTNQIGNSNVVAAQAKGNSNGNNGNQIRCYNYRGLGHLARNYTFRPRRRDVAYLQT
ncbi:hypothetical protein Tco_0708218 [Tanacetum coccineum]